MDQSPTLFHRIWTSHIPQFPDKVTVTDKQTDRHISELVPFLLLKYGILKSNIKRNNVTIKNFPFGLTKWTDYVVFHDHFSSVIN